MNPEPTPRPEHADRPASSLRRFVPYRDDTLDAESVISGCTMVGLLCVAGLLLAGVTDLGIAA